MDPFATITNLVDSAAHKADAVPQAEVDNDPKPIEADESFDDFVYSYASDDALQRQRTKFPLPFYDVDKPSGKQYTLYNLPFYYAGQLESFLNDKVE